MQQAIINRILVLQLTITEEFANIQRSFVTICGCGPYISIGPSVSSSSFSESVSSNISVSVATLSVPTPLSVCVASFSVWVAQPIPFALLSAAISRSICRSICTSMGASIPIYENGEINLRKMPFGSVGKGKFTY
uniref:Uncharacterized protein n=1 Tax=Glossina palpalis gambiensis TaxID=67801 RepID=A0A1B0ASR4_9MUSC